MTLKRRRKVDLDATTPRPNARMKKALPQTKALYRIEVALAQTQPGQIGFEDVAVGRARAHGELRIDQGIDVDALEVFADRSQSDVGTEVVAQFFDNKVGHVRIHLVGEWNMRSKSFI